MPQSDLSTLLSDIQRCRICEAHLDPRPVVRAGASATVLIIGQAPGSKVHQTGIPWNDASGKRLREWLQLDEETFYNEQRVAIVPMGFCYPGKGKSGDLPPRPECAAQWHEALWQQLPNIKITLLIGQYAQKHYLQDNYSTLTERVKNWEQCPSNFFPLPHPSPRNQFWLKRNAWFEAETLPDLQRLILKNL